jgi:hypothetical protein
LAAKAVTKSTSLRDVVAGNDEPASIYGFAGVLLGDRAESLARSDALQFLGSEGNSSGSSNR